MTRGTTTTNIFNTTEDLSGSTVYVSYFQRGRKILEKKSGEIIIEPDRVVVPLSQIETLRFSAELPISIQIRYVRSDGIVHASNIVITTINDILKKGVIEHDR